MSYHKDADGNPQTYQELGIAILVDRDLLYSDPKYALSLALSRARHELSKFSSDAVETQYRWEKLVTVAGAGEELPWSWAIDVMQDEQARRQARGWWGIRLVMQGVL